MNLITKLLMENEVIINQAKTITKGNVIPSIAIFIGDVEELPTKKDLLTEVQEQYYVSNLEWELLNYWKDIGVEKIYKNKNNDDIVLCGLIDQYLQPSSTYQIFKFIRHEEYYVLDDLINRCALIEG
ncbi:MAG: hypothetical protein KHY19_02515 [Coprobacillus cateniformis]|nr:hypothetical protein [Coprobacillus cateniformis]